MLKHGFGGCVGRSGSVSGAISHAPERGRDLRKRDSFIIHITAEVQRYAVMFNFIL